MGFLDNSGDIILDAVLTDLGRKRMAEGTFTISQFALGDDEINYANYNPNHPSGSAYYDLEIIQTPILESFTNNTSTMKSRLLTLSNNNFLYLPVIIENPVKSENRRHSSNTYIVAVDKTTQVDTSINPSGVGVGRDSTGPRQGVLYGVDPADGGSIMLHQGIDNVGRPRTQQIEGGLRESTFVIQIDGRFGEIVNVEGAPVTTVDAVTEDDDGFLFYTVTTGDTSKIAADLDTNAPLSNLAGARGSVVNFAIKASSILTDNQSYFDRFGFSKTIDGKACKAIDSTIRVTGMVTGYSIDIPVRFTKQLAP